MRTICGWCCADWRYRSAILALAVGLGVAAGGCYTLLGHPGAGDAVADAEGFSGECLRCHAESGYVETGSDPWIGYLRSSNVGWINYYGSPHWLDWRWARLPAESAKAPSPPSGRLAWGRVPLHRLEADGDPTRVRNPIATPLPLPGPIAAPGIAPAAPAPAAAQPGQENPQEEEKPKTVPASGRGLRR